MKTLSVMLFLTMVQSVAGVPCSPHGMFAQKEDRQVNRDPARSKFVTSDIENFWRAFDLANKEPERTKRIAIFQTEYIDKGSVGLQDFTRSKIKSAKDLAETVEKLPRFYASVRAGSLRVKKMEEEIRRAFRKFKDIYPEAVFPDVYFLIGIANAGGTVSKNGLLIGTELYGLTPETPRDEFLGWFKSLAPSGQDESQVRSMLERFLSIALNPIDKLPPIVAHESVHFNQQYPEHKSLLANSIEEGSADFIAEKIAGETISPRRQAYGNQHEAELWREFQTEMNGTNTGNWLSNALTAKDRPPDLGYFIGYKICESYYKHSKDKHRAIRDILQIKDFAAFLEQSRYREKFAGGSNPGQ